MCVCGGGEWKGLFVSSLGGVGGGGLLCFAYFLYDLIFFFFFWGGGGGGGGGGAVAPSHVLGYKTNPDNDFVPPSAGLYRSKTSVHTLPVSSRL